MAKKKPTKKAEPVDLEKKLAKLEEWLKEQVKIKGMGGDPFTSFPEL